MSEIECDCCGRDASSGQDFFCISCARNSLYLARLETARILLEKEGLSTEIESATETSSTGTDPSRKKDHVRIAWQNEVAQAQNISARARIEEAKSQATVIRGENESMREEIAKRKADLIDRKKTLATINTILPNRQRNTLDTIGEMCGKGTTSFGTNTNRLLTTRAFLCRETASLLRLRLKRRMKDGVVKERYSITGMLLPDLRDINTIRCTDLSAALHSVAHLVTLVAFYLGVRLPAEITTPHRNYPLATINTPVNSYLGVRVAFPGSGSISTAPSSPFSSKHDVKSSHRPRPLFIGSDDRDEKVAQFAKRDPSAFNFFVEGISLLAWDIAWLSRSQGFTIGTTAWEDVCNIGRLLSTLLATPQSPAMQRVLSDREARKRNNQLSSSPPKAAQQSPTSASSATSSTPGKLASTSHHTSFSASLLTLPANMEAIKSWKLSKHQLISDALKKHLLTEMNNAEWEILQEQEWDDGGEAFEGASPGDTAVFVGAKKTVAGETTQLTIDAQARQPELAQESGGRTSPAVSGGENAKINSGRGWTKLRERDK